jgi:phosphatidate cytidylyltransferase
MLLPRVLTVVITVPFLLASIYFGSLPFFFLVLGISTLALREFYFLAEETGYDCLHMEGLVAGVLMIISVFLNGTAAGKETENQGTAALTALLLLYFVIRSLKRGPSDTLLSTWSVTFFGVFYVAWSLSHLLLLRDLRPFGMEVTFMLFLMVWAADVAAYFVGMRWGKHAIAPKISPKKTWEGLAGGLVAAGIIALCFQMKVLKSVLSVSEALMLAIVFGLLAFLSDLSESLLKRSAGVKDSSLLIPGHGGFLDRFDSFLLTTPLFYYYWAFIKH